MARRHIAISGTGRAGTTFLVELLTHLGLDTGYSPSTLNKYKSPLARAGLEHDLRNPNSPYVVKSPWLCDYCEEVVADTDIFIEHLFICIRDVTAAAESRRYVTEQTVASMSLIKQLRFRLFPKTLPGGLWHTFDGSHQEDVLLKQVYKLALCFSKTSVPVSLLHFPKIVKQPEYLFRKLEPVLQGISLSDFEEAFTTIARAELVHQFCENDR